VRYSELEVASSERGRVRTLTVPGGALTAQTARELTDAALACAEDRTIRVVVLVAAGDDFCTGAAADLDPISVSPDPAAALAALRPPVVAACVGRCSSVGLEVLLTADVRLAHPSATFALDDAGRGQLPCWGGMQRLSRAIRPAEATAMVLLGDVLDAPRALSLGLVHDVGDSIGQLVDGTVERLLQMGPLALELAKEAVHRGAEMPLRDGLRLEGDLNHLLAATDDRAEGLAAFFAKRLPDFSGR
jgi:enoyl-CoA hydratase/carnithine racemase